jgi:hypothetical protein
MLAVLPEYVILLDSVGAVKGARAVTVGTKGANL